MFVSWCLGCPASGTFFSLAHFLMATAISSACELAVSCRIWMMSRRVSLQSFTLRECTWNHCTVHAWSTHEVCPSLFLAMSTAWGLSQPRLSTSHHQLELANAGTTFAFPVFRIGVQLLQNVKGFSSIVELPHLHNIQQGVTKGPCYTHCSADLVAIISHNLQQAE